MKPEKHFISDEELNAFLDEQLDANERDRVLAAINADSDVNQRMNELRLLRDMVQHAYEQPSRRENVNEYRADASKPYTRWAMAACMVLCFGVVLGWFGHQGVTSDKQLANLSDRSPNAQLSNVILHLTSADAVKINATLDRAEQMLAGYKAGGKDFQLEIVANDGGLTLMREGASSFQPRIKALTEKYDNVTFLACAKAIKHLQEKGVDVELLPEVGIAPSALKQIIQRMQQDWHYIKA